MASHRFLVQLPIPEPELTEFESTVTLSGTEPPGFPPTSSFLDTVCIPLHKLKLHDTSERLGGCSVMRIVLDSSGLRHATYCKYVRVQDEDNGWSK